MRLTCLVLLFLFCFNFCAAQETCGLETAPALLGVRLDMSPEQVQSVFGKDLKVKFKTRDEKIIFQNFIDKPAPSSLAGVRALYLRFFDQRLYQVEVFYEETREVKTLKDFIDSLSSSRNFPASNWQEETGKAVINCERFTVIADKVLNPHIEITDEMQRAKVEAIRKQKSKKK